MTSPTSITARRANPNKKYIVSPSGLVSEILTHVVLCGKPISVRTEEGINCRYHTASEAMLIARGTLT